MILRVFPAIYPDEMLYSVLARYARNLGGLGPAATSLDLFGHRAVIASFDLPGRLGSLAERLPVERGLDVSAIVRRTTLYPYYTAFSSAELRSDLASAMAGSISGYHLRLGIAAFTTARTTTLRFCPACRAAMTKEHGEPYWRRSHQLPGVLVCPDHGEPLRVSRISCQTLNRHAYWLPNDAACPDEALPAVRTKDPVTLRRLSEVARASAALLEDPPPSTTLAEIGTRYRERVAAAGFMRSRRRIDQPGLLAAFREHFGQALQHLPVSDPADGEEGWLAALTRKQRKAAHPLLHVLFDLFLEAQGQHREISDGRPIGFGSGPWLCRNPLARHHGQPVVADLAWYRNRDAHVGIFTCGCGYVYTRGVDRAGRLGPPRYRAYGPLLADVLPVLIAEKLGLRAVARRLRLDPKTVATEAGRLGLVTPWACQPVTARGTTQAKAPLELPERLRDRERRGPRKDWLAVDRELIVRLRHLETVIRREAPPVRASVAEFERRLGRRGWLCNRRRLLPLTTAFLDAHQETVAAFQGRRLEWVIQSLTIIGSPPAAWRACALAGLSCAWIPVAERHLARLVTKHLSGDR